MAHTTEEQVGGAHGVANAVTSDLDGFGFSHMVLEVGNLDGSERWYRDVVGLDVLGRDLLAVVRVTGVRAGRVRGAAVVEST